MGFNLDNYEDVHSRKERFKKLWPTSRVVKDVLYHDFQLGYVLVSTSIFLRFEDDKPSAVDIAFGERDTYPSNLRKFYVEDTSTSSEGRAYDLVLETATKPTRQNMERVGEPKKFTERLAEKIPVEKPSDPWTIEQKEMPVNLEDALTQLNQGTKPEEIPHCKHGVRKVLQGVGKTNRPYYGYGCQQPKNEGQCDAIWCVLDKSGKWVIPKPKVETEELQ